MTSVRVSLILLWTCIVLEAIARRLGGSDVFHQANPDTGGVQAVVAIVGSIGLLVGTVLLWIRKSGVAWATFLASAILMVVHSGIAEPYLIGGLPRALSTTEGILTGCVIVTGAPRAGRESKVPRVE